MSYSNSDSNNIWATYMESKTSKIPPKSNPKIPSKGESKQRGSIKEQVHVASLNTFISNVKLGPGEVMLLSPFKHKDGSPIVFTRVERVGGKGAHADLIFYNKDKAVFFMSMKDDSQLDFSKFVSKKIEFPAWSSMKEIIQVMGKDADPDTLSFLNLVQNVCSEKIVNLLDTKSPTNTTYNSITGKRISKYHYELPHPLTGMDQTGYRC